MPKNIDDVILPERRKSIRNIPIPEGRSKKGEKVALDGVKRPARVAEDREEVSHEAERHESSRRTHNPKKKIWLASGFAILVLIFSVLSMFKGGTLSYVPKSVDLKFANDIFSAVKTGEDKLTYSVVKLSGDKGVSVPATGEQAVSRKASGMIVVYNDASAEPQKLVENTRFESPTGKIYRIATAITIPGKKTVAGKSQPGSIEVKVNADVAGAEYNSEPTDFTVPGLKGSPRYTTIYARSSTAISGGFVGKEKAVAPADLEKAKAELKTSLSQGLLAKAQAEVPSEFILFPTLSSVSFEDLPQSNTGSGSTVTVNLRGHLYGIMFKKNDLSHELGKKKASLAKDDSVELVSFDSLELAFAGVAPTNLLSLNEISFKVTGESKLVWRTDEVALKSDILGRKKSELSTILKNYPTISSASATLRPFWKTTFPLEGDKVSVKKLEIK